MSDSEKYEVLEKIGHGSFGIIHKVRRKLDGYILCRKEISYSRMSQKEMQQLQAELSILKELRHPNIVAYYEREHIKLSQDLHLYMEYCGNGDLGQVIKRLKGKNQYAEEEFVWTVFAQLVSALYRCHYGEDPPDVGRDFLGLAPDAKPRKTSSDRPMILHRDLKPENVFLDATNSVKLGDFGLSKSLPSHTFAQTYVGTPFYMSPEICTSQPYTLYSDIWALGCIIYELCAREPPFNAKTHWDLIQKIKAGRIQPLPPVYSPELQKVVNSCLNVAPTRRPDTASLLSLPVVKLMRKEQEVVSLGLQLKAEKDLATQTLRDAEVRLRSVDADKAAYRVEIENQVRREWEVKARLEIDRHVALELSRLQKDFESEVQKRVEADVVQRLASAAANPTLNAPVLEPLQQESPPRSSTPTNLHGSTILVEPSALTSSLSPNGDLDFPSLTDISSLSNFDITEETEAESPLMSKKAVKRSSRTPFTRARTMFAQPTESSAAPSPMDVSMADPSPLSSNLAGLSLSPRRNKDAQAIEGFNSSQKSFRAKPNIFALATDKTGADRWQSTSADDIATSPHSPSIFHGGYEETAFDEALEDEEERSPSRTRKSAPKVQQQQNDPFAVLASTKEPVKKQRPSLGRAKTSMPAQSGRLSSAPGLFGVMKKDLEIPVIPSRAKSAQDTDEKPAARPKSRLMSGVPVIAASPNRRPPSAKNLTSPTRKMFDTVTGQISREAIQTSPKRPAVATAAVGAATGKAEGGLRSKKGNEDMIKTALRNQLQGRTLVELNQARVPQSTEVKDFAAVKVKELKDTLAPVWDVETEGEEGMPSPFLRKNAKVVR